MHFGRCRLLERLTPHLTSPSLPKQTKLSNPVDLSAPPPRFISKLIFTITHSPTEGWRHVRIHSRIIWGHIDTSSTTQQCPPPANLVHACIYLNPYPKRLHLAALAARKWARRSHSCTVPLVPVACHHRNALSYSSATAQTAVVSTVDQTQLQKESVPFGDDEHIRVARLPLKTPRAFINRLRRSRRWCLYQLGGKRHQQLLLLSTQSQHYIRINL